MSAGDASRADVARERRYRRLLRLYPAEYQRERGPELMATLLEAAENGRRPELAALVLGALRAHTGWERRSIRSIWLAALRAAALMLLITAVASTPLMLAAELAKGAPVGRWMLQMDPPDLVAAPIGLLAIVAVARGRHRVAAGLAVLAFAAGTATFALAGQAGQGNLLRYLFVVLLLIPLWRGAPAPARGLLRYLPLVALLLLAALRLVVNLAPGRGEFALTVAFCAAALLWVVVDERVTLAIGLLFSGDVLYFLAAVAFAAARGRALLDDPWTLLNLAAVIGVAPVLLLLVSAATTRRRSRV